MAQSRSTAVEKDWTEGNPVRNILALSWPIMISDGLRIIGPTIDMIWIGKLGAASVAGLGLGGMFNLIVMFGVMGINTGMMALIARFMGRKDKHGANHVAQQAIAVCIIYSILIAFIGILFAEQIMGLLGMEADVIAEGASYIRITFAGTVAIALGMTFEGIMQASGDSVTPMRISLYYRIIHIVLCPFLIFGLWIFPRMGVSGAALVNIFSQFIGMGLALFALSTGRTRIRLVLKGFRLDPKTIWRIIRIGFPFSLGMAGRVVGRLVIYWFMSPFGTVAVAAHAVVERIEIFLTTPGFGFGKGSAVLVGQNLGARQPERAERSGWLGVFFVEIVMLIAAAIMFFYPEWIIGAFSSDPELIREGSVFLQILVPGLFLLGIIVVLEFSLVGAGDTIPPMFGTFVSLLLVPVPVALFFRHFTGFGVYGIRWAVVIGLAAGSLGYIIYWRLGRWKKTNV